jgi:hypothetical protein
MVFGMTIDGGAVGSGKRREETKSKKGLGRGLTEWQLFKAGLEFLGGCPEVILAVCQSR